MCIWVLVFGLSAISFLYKDDKGKNTVLFLDIQMYLPPVVWIAFAFYMLAPYRYYNGKGR